MYIVYAQMLIGTVKTIISYGGGGGVLSVLPVYLHHGASLPSLTAFQFHAFMRQSLSLSLARIFSCTRVFVEKKTVCKVSLPSLFHRVTHILIHTQITKHTTSNTTYIHTISGSNECAQLDIRGNTKQNIYTINAVRNSWL